MKKLLTIIAAVCLSLVVALAFIACDGNKAEDSKYYAYDVDSGEYDTQYYIDVRGDKCSMVSHDDGISVAFNGTIKYEGNSFVITISYSYYGAEIQIVLKGEKESFGVLRVDSEKVTIEGITDTQNEISYFCNKGCEPKNPQKTPDNQDQITGTEHTVVFNANGGNFDGQPSVEERTTDWRVSLPENPPTRDGYVFKEYNRKPNGLGYTVYDGSTFSGDTTVYAVWERAYKVTFMNGVEIVEIRTVVDSGKLGEPPIPKSPEGYVFKGWYHSEYRSIQFISFSIVTSDTTLYAEWRTADELTSYAEECASWTEDGHLYIHYWRNDHYCWDEKLINSTGPLYNSPLSSETYGDWLLWAWPKNGEGRAFYPARIDKTGAVYDIDLNYVFHDGGWDSDKHYNTNKDVQYKDCDLGIMFFMGSSKDDPYWKNDGGNIYISRSTIESTRHIYFRQGETSNPQYTYA